MFAFRDKFGKQTNFALGVTRFEFKQRQKS